MGRVGGNRHSLITEQIEQFSRKKEMDSAPITNILKAQREIDKATMFTPGLSLRSTVEIHVDNYDDIEAIAEIIYGSDGWSKVHHDFTGGWTTAWVKSPEGVMFNYSDYSLDDAIFHIQSAEFGEKSTRVTQQEVKAVSA